MKSLNRKVHRRTKYSKSAVGRSALLAGLKLRLAGVPMQREGHYSILYEYDGGRSGGVAFEDSFDDAKLKAAEIMKDGTTIKMIKPFEAADTRIPGEYARRSMERGKR